MSRLAVAMLWTLAACGAAARCEACPFCGAVGQPLASRRDATAGVAVGEADGPARLQADGVMTQPFLLRQWLSGPLPLPQAPLMASVTAPVQGTAAVFVGRGGAGGDRLAPTAMQADETRLGYLAAAPAVEEPAARRLRWFARWLEHPDPVVAADAFAEFGQASFEAVREAADALPAARLRGWAADPGVDQQRRGFYGLALGLVAAADSGEREACRKVLFNVIEQPADDFRAGFDGFLAGVLVADGEAGLAALRARGLLEPSARPVEKRQMLAVLRFAWESLGEEIPQDRVAVATAELLQSPVTAAEATVDLARYRWWAAVDEVASLWTELGDDDPLVRRAVAGYLIACPSPEAKRHAAEIRRLDPDRFEQAVQASRLPLAR